MLYLETIERTTLDLLKKLQSLSIFANSRLVGGTALALQLGHRKSIDLDIFGSIEASPEEILQVCKEVGKLKISNTSKNFNVYWIDGIKVDCVNYPYKWLEECKVIDGVRLASVNDIAAMKISAIINRGTKKDFIDLYFLLREMSLNQILDLYDEKYLDGSRFVAIKNLTFFEDAETDPMPYMINQVTWDDIKTSIIAEIKKL